MPQLTDSFFEDSKNEEILGVTSDSIPAADSLEWFSGNISSYYKSNIKIAHLNINSIQNKLDEVKDMLNQHMFDVLFAGRNVFFYFTLSPRIPDCTKRSEKRCRRIN